MIHEKSSPRPPASTSRSQYVCGACARVLKSVAAVFRRHDGMPSLAMVLAGDTCYPVSLKNFEAYLIHKEHTVEILQFIVWFQDYRRRFLALPAAAQAASPGRAQFAFALPTPARTAQRVQASIARADSVCRAGGEPSIMSTTTKSDAGLAAPSDYAPSLCSRSANHYAYPLSTPNTPLLSSAEAPSAQSAPPAVRLREQPFRQECLRIVATFLKPGAAKELPLDPVVRDTAFRDLAWNTHPDVFLPVYEETYQTLETISLPRFLAAAAANINRPRRLLWYAIGAAETALAVLLLALLVGFVRVPPQPHRAWRLFAVLPATAGLTTIYSAYRGFCSQVWGRRATQLHEWELEEMDGAEARPRWDSLTPTFSSSSSSSSSSSASACSESAPRAGDAPDAKLAERWDEHGGAARAPAAAAAFTLAPLPIAAATRAPSLLSRLLRASPRPAERDLERARVDAYAGRRAPLFGPEKAVLDPRIRALHRAVVRDLVCVALAATAVVAAVALAVPGRHG